MEFATFEGVSNNIPVETFDYNPVKHFSETRSTSTLIASETRDTEEVYFNLISSGQRILLAGVVFNFNQYSCEGNGTFEVTATLTHNGVDIATFSKELIGGLEFNPEDINIKELIQFDNGLLIGRGDRLKVKAEITAPSGRTATSAFNATISGTTF